ncbi:MAG TPA: serine hydrolase [Blastocatellia bacterium]|nr:serine hydrolase [Blastocatellia bacterium]HMV82693.1 serine hydrolase [Blastocatellia bacterium]HMX27336.1 serine hydrolase [Blastocatellia bacterium]HMY73982.1 serine hydrolase [Blastocatellia bacterium]HMZ16790.1 serine hydrolase [Blastocatellia bacterium]
MTRKVWLSVSLVLLEVVAVANRPSVASQNADKVFERIARVEKGLLPAVVIKGQSGAMTIADRLAHYKVPGVSVAVINDGKLEWSKGYGVTEAGGTTPVKPETMFQAASISKPVAAMGMLALVEQGKLSLDEDVNAKLKSWKVPDNEFTKEQKVTLRRLASHSAGLTVHGFRGYAADEPVPTAVQLLDGQKPANSAPVRVNVLPGSLWRYSGGGITVMQLLMADVTGKAFPALMRESVLDKLGMKNSTYEQPLPTEYAVRAATGHRSNGQAIKGKWHTYPEMAAAGLWTTPSDLAKFAVEIQQANAGKSAKVLSQAMVKQLLTKQSGDYGLGVAVGGEGNARTFSHSGSNEGFKCLLFAYTETGKGAVVMTNGDQGSQLANEILRGIAREYGWPDYQTTERTLAKVNPEVFNAYIGDYNVNGTVKITAENGKLYIQPPGETKSELFAESETEFFLTSGNVRIVFVKDEQGAVNAVKVYFGGRAVDGKRIK